MLNFLANLFYEWERLTYLVSQILVEDLFFIVMFLISLFVYIFTAILIKPKKVVEEP